jgi:hypothetical protein
MRPEETNIRTLTVTGSRTAGRPDGRVAIVLETLEAGPIAFEVHLQAIASLRRELAAAEAFLRQSTGSA